MTFFGFIALGFKSINGFRWSRMPSFLIFRLMLTAPFKGSAYRFMTIFDACSNNNESSNYKTIWEVLLVRSLIFLAPYSAIRSHLYKPKYRFLKPSIRIRMHFFLLDLIHLALLNVSSIRSMFDSLYA